MLLLPCAIYFSCILFADFYSLYHFLLLFTILLDFQIPNSDKKMFDQCPWPFTLFHDPIKFVGDGATHVVILWSILCQVYSRFAMARAIIP